MKKITFIFLSTLIFTFSIVIQPFEKAYAATGILTPEMPNGHVDETAALIGTAILLTAAVGAATDEMIAEQTDKFVTDFKREYANASVEVKESFNTAIDQAYAGGSNYLELSETGWDFIKQSLTNVLTDEKVYTYQNASGFTVENTYNPGSLKSVKVSAPDYIIRLQIDEYTTRYYGILTLGIEKDFYGVNITLRRDGSGTYTKVLDATSGYTDEQLQTLFDSINGITTISGILSYYNSINAPGDYDTRWVNPVSDSIYDPTLKRALENDIPRMQDAGLVLPRPEARTNTGQRLKVDTATGGLTLDGIPYTGDYSWDWGKARVRDGAVVYEQAPTATGDTTWTDVNTGVTTGETTWDNIKTGEIDTPIPETTIPDFTKNPTKKIDFAPLLITGASMTEKFPFSIPWDFLKQIKVLDVEPQAPVFKINIARYISIDGLDIPMKFDIDLSFFDMVADWIRWGNVILFDIGLLFAIRKLLPE